MNEFWIYIAHFTSLHGLQDVENDSVRSLERYRVADWSKKFHFSAFPMYYSLYNWIGEHEITKLKEDYIYIFSIYQISG